MQSDCVDEGAILMQTLSAIYPETQRHNSLASAILPAVSRRVLPPLNATVKIVTAARASNKQLQQQQQQEHHL